MTHQRKKQKHEPNPIINHRPKGVSERSSLIGMKHRYDFEVGYLVRSPCTDCHDRSNFPGCEDTCDVLDKIHTTLCNCISCTKHG